MGEVELDEVMLLSESIDTTPHTGEDDLVTTVVYTIEDKDVGPIVDDEEEMETNEVNYQTTDPVQLLKALSPMLGNNGEIRSADEIPAITKLMKDAEKLVSKCVYSNILRATTDSAVLEAFVAEGGWDVLNDWLQEARTDVNDAFLRELLKVYSQIPISVSLLKQNACAKTIKQISKSDNAGLKALAAGIVDRWMSTVRQASGDNAGPSSDKSKKRKHSHKEKDSREKDKKSSKDSKVSPDDKEKARSSPERDATPFYNTISSKPEPTKPRPKTVKMVPTKFRSTGLEQETVLPPTRKKGSAEKDLKSNPLKRPSIQVPKSAPAEKKARPALPSPLPSTTTATPIDKKGGVKFIQPRPKPVQVYESAGFMDALTTTTTPAGLRRRRKGSGSKLPNTPTSPPGGKQPTVPSFYQDTLETNEEEPSGGENAENDEGSVVTQNNEEGAADVDAAAQSGAEPTAPKKKKKKVSWAEEAQLKRFFYFEMDETERVNVNKQKDFASSIKDEMRMERQCFESNKRQHSQEALAGGIMWRRPRPVSGLQHTVIRGCNSTERDAQKQREQGVLQALFFSKSMIPDSPGEPETEAYEPVDPKNIPLEDETGGAGETVFTEYPKPVEMVEPPHSSHKSQSRGGGGGVSGPATSAGLTLPPDIANLVASMAQQSKMNDQVLQQQHHQHGQQQHQQQQQHGLPSQTAHNGAYSAGPQQFPQGNGMGIPPPQGANHAMMNMAPPPNYQHYGHPPNGPLDQPPSGPLGPPPSGPHGPPPSGPHGPPPSGPHGPPPYGPPPHGHPHGPPPHMQGMRGPDEEWGENLHGGPMMGPGPCGPPPPGMPPHRGGGGAGYRMPRGHPGPPRGRGMPGPPGPPRMCRHFMKAGGCRFEKNCVFIHPGVNGPPL